MEAPWESCTSPRLTLLFVHNGPKRDGASA